jgi:hypothetical protein
MSNGIQVIAEGIVWGEPGLSNHACLPMISCENINGVCDKTSVLAALSEKYHCKAEDCKLYTKIEVPFSEIMYFNEAARITIKENSLYDLFDELPVSVTAKVPLEALQKFYEDKVLCDADYASGEDIRLSKWIGEEYTLDETEGLLLWLETEYGCQIKDLIDFDGSLKMLNEKIEGRQGMSVNETYKQAEKVIEGLNPNVADAVYRLLWKEHVIKDVKTQLEQDERSEHMSEESYDALASQCAERYCMQTDYDCNLDYWTNIQNLIDDEISGMEDIERE